MDPDANLKEARELARDILAKFDQSDDTPQWDEADIVRLAELMHALDEWITGGGFLPRDWQAGR